MQIFLTKNSQWTQKFGKLLSSNLLISASNLHLVQNILPEFTIQSYSFLATISASSFGASQLTSSYGIIVILTLLKYPLLTIQVKKLINAILAQAAPECCINNY